MTGTGKYNGMEIDLIDGKFRVDELEQSYETYKQATESIDRASRAKSSVKKIAIPVICGDGTVQTITGIHSGHGAMTMRPKMKRLGQRGSSDLYPLHNLIRKAIEERKIAESRLIAIDSILRKLCIERTWTEYGYDPATIKSDIASLEKQASDKLKLAEKMDLEKEIVKAMKD